MHRKWKRLLRILKAELGLTYSGKDSTVDTKVVPMKGLQLVYIFIIMRYFTNIDGKPVPSYCMTVELLRIDGDHIHIIASKKYAILDTELRNIRTLKRDIVDLKKEGDSLLASTKSLLESNGA